jgi:hypothetical protein
MCPEDAREQLRALDNSFEYVGSIETVLLPWRTLWDDTKGGVKFAGGATKASIAARHHLRGRCRLDLRSSTGLLGPGTDQPSEHNKTLTQPLLFRAHIACTISSRTIHGRRHTLTHTCR